MRFPSPGRGRKKRGPLTIDEELNLLDQQLRRLKIEYEIYFNNPKKRPPTDVEWKVLSLLRKFSDGARISFGQRFRYNEMAQRYAVQSDLWRKKSRIREEGYRRPADALLGIQGVRTFEDTDDATAIAQSVSEHEIDETLNSTNESLEAAASEALSAVAQAAPWPTAAQPELNRGATPKTPPVAQAAAIQSNGTAAAAKTAVSKPAPAKVPAPAARKSPYIAQLRDVEHDKKNVESLYQALVEAKKNAGEKLGDAANFDSFSSFVKKKTDQIKKQYACEKVEYSVELEGGKVKLKAKAAPKS